MRKLRSDSFWHKLTDEQKNRIQHWLFVKNLSYAQTHERMRTELGIACGLSAIHLLYHYLRELRSHDRETVLDVLTDVIARPGTDLAGVRADSLAIINRQLLERAAQRDDSREIAALGRVLVQSEGREIERQRVELARKKLALSRTLPARPSGSCGSAAQVSGPGAEQHPN